MAPWNQGQQLPQQMYDRFNGYPMHQGSYQGASGSGSPMNYGAWYPPSTFAGSPAYGAASSGPAYRGNPQTGNPTYNHATSGAQFNQFGAAATGQTGNINGNGNTMSGAAANNNQHTGYDPAMLAALQNMSFGSK